MLTGDWTPVVVMAAGWGALCAFTGPLVATAIVAGLIALGGVLAREIGRAMFGEGGQ